MRIEPDIERIISASLLRLRCRSPFFATLALFANLQATTALATAATDGKNIFFNPDFLRSLPSEQVDSFLLHFVLHAALLHVPRQGTRELKRWNAAADIAVNGMLQEQGYYLFPDALSHPKLQRLSVEEIYELLPPKVCCSDSQLDLLSQSPDETLQEGHGDKTEQQQSDSLAQAKQATLKIHWQNAIHQAMFVARSSNNQGSIPAFMERELGVLTRSKLDWRSYLWRYLVQTPNDFMGFDRRFIGRKLYLETLQGESVKVFVAVDTSGSINNRLLQMFFAEVQGILNSYPHLICELYYTDAQVYGPYRLETSSEIPKPVGGGGTSFVPFFEKVSVNRDWHECGVCVYLTDGYGTFPKEQPVFPVLWVVTPGGLNLEQFPFGETVRLLSDS